MANREDIQEEIVVIFHAAVLGRTDVLQNALAAIKAQGRYSSVEISNVLSMSRPEDGATPLHLAANFGHSDVIRALLNGGADLTIRPTHGEFKGKRAYELANDTVKQAFHVYFFEHVAMGNIVMIEQLFKGGLPNDLRDGSKLEDTALHWATSFGNLDVLRTLLLNGCDIDCLNAEGSSPLLVACKNGFTELVRVLLEEGANVTLTDKNGQAPSTVTNIPEIIALFQNPPEVLMTLRNRAQEHQTDTNDNNINSRNNNGFASATDLLAAAAADDNHDAPNGVVNQSLDDSIFFDDETDFNVNPADHHHEEGEEESDDILLVFWPPVQRQKRLSHQIGLELRGQENLFIAVSNNETDMLPLLHASGLLDALDALGLLVQVRRSNNAKGGAKLRLVVDKMLCPMQHGYSLRITATQATIIAHDITGLQYSIQSFLQVIHLHSIVSKDEGGITTITIPAIMIEDWPLIPVRAVLRSYRRDLRWSSVSQLQREVELLSRLRISRLMVILDMDNEEDSDGISALLTACQQHHLEVIPTLTLSSLGDGLPIDTLKAFSSTMIVLILVLDIETCRRELTTLSEGKVSLREYCMGQCQSMLKEAVTVGIMSIQLSCPAWYEKLADPISVAASLGLSLVLTNNSTFLPPVLFTRPLLAVQQHVGLLARHVQRLELEKEYLAVLPTMTERDATYPQLLLKFFLFVYAGLVWNRVSAADMLGLSPSEQQQQGDDYEQYDGSIIREVLRLMLFPLDLQGGSGGSSSNSRSNKVGLQTIVTLLTTNWRSLCSHALGSDHVDAVSPGMKSNILPELEEIAQVERMLWQLIGLIDDRQVFPLPSRRAAGHCLRLYRRLLTLAQWKPQRNLSNFLQLQQGQGSFLDFLGMGSATVVVAAFSSTPNQTNGNLAGNSKQLTTQTLTTAEMLSLEIDEFFVAIQFLCGLCKVTLQAGAAYQRISSRTILSKSNLNMIDVDQEEDGMTMEVPYQQLLRALPAGARSDLANVLLESLGQYSALWRQRHDPRFFATLRAATTFVDQSKEDGDNDVDMVGTARDIARRYLLQAEPRPPVLAVLQLLCEGLPVPQTLQSYLGHIFSE